MALRWWLPENASAGGIVLDQHLLLNLWIATGLLTLAHLILIGGLIARRRHAEATSTSLWRIEYLPLAALAILFTALTVKAERLWAIARYTGASPAAMQIEVTGAQFAWYFRYPGPDAIFGVTRPTLVAPGEGNPVRIDGADPNSAGDFVTSELVLLSNREIDLRIRSQDVIHGFAIPELRLKQNAIPGQTIHLHFTPTKTGTYAILCTQLCGLGHYRMNANLRILPPDEFNAWIVQHGSTSNHP